MLYLKTIIVRILLEHKYLLLLMQNFALLRKTCCCEWQRNTRETRKLRTYPKRNYPTAVTVLTLATEKRSKINVLSSSPVISLKASGG